MKKLAIPIPPNHRVGNPNSAKRYKAFTVSASSTSPNIITNTTTINAYGIADNNVNIPPAILFLNNDDSQKIRAGARYKITGSPITLTNIRNKINFIPKNQPTKSGRRICNIAPKNNEQTTANTDFQIVLITESRIFKKF